MNEKQRNYLVETLSSNAKAKVRAIEALIPEMPSLENHLMKTILSGELKLRPEKDIINMIVEKATNLKRREYLIVTDRWDDEKDEEYFINLPVAQLFELPEDYKILYEEHVRVKKLYEKEIQKVEEQQKSLETRIRLASDKTLEPLIEEVNQMGKISFEDSQMKSLAEPVQIIPPQKLLK